MVTLNKDKAEEIFRRLVLEAMDAAAYEIFKEHITFTPSGATDADLPAIFKLLDQQLERLAARFDCHLSPVVDVEPDFFYVKSGLFYLELTADQGKLLIQRGEQYNQAGASAYFNKMEGGK